VEALWAAVQACEACEDRVTMARRSGASPADLEAAGAELAVANTTHEAVLAVYEAIDSREMKAATKALITAQENRAEAWAVQSAARDALNAAAVAFAAATAVADEASAASKFGAWHDCQGELNAARSDLIPAAAAAAAFDVSATSAQHAHSNALGSWEIIAEAQDALDDARTAARAAHGPAVTVPPTGSRQDPRDPG
jgi:hypothetical protein